jgi:hypothetical protein
LIVQLRLRRGLEVPINERPADILFVVSGYYRQIAGLDLTAVREV